MIAARMPPSRPPSAPKAPLPRRAGPATGSPSRPAPRPRPKRAPQQTSTSTSAPRWPRLGHLVPWLRRPAAPAPLPPLAPEAPPLAAPADTVLPLPRPAPLSPPDRDEILAPQRLPVIGTLPPDLRGVLYRNGPQQDVVYGQQVGHLFDGNGMIFRTDIRPEGVTYQARYVATPEKLHEDRERRQIYPGFGTQPAGSWAAALERAVRSGLRIKNPANINVALWPGRERDVLLALSDVGPPLALHPDTLETLPARAHGLGLPAGQPLAAHIKTHGPSGDTWGFSVAHGPHTTLSLHPLSAAGRPRPRQVRLPYEAVLHDFVITETYKAVFFVSPLVVDLHEGLKSRLGWSTALRAIKYDPQLPSYVIEVDLRPGGKVRQVACEPMFVLHLANAFEQDGALVVDVCAHPDASVLSTTTTAVTDKVPNQARLRRLRVRQGSVSVEPLPGPNIEFPRVVPAFHGRPYSTVYGVSARPGTLDASVLRVDLDSGDCFLGALEDGHFAREAVPVPKARPRHPERDVHLLAFTGTKGANSTLRLYDGADLPRGAVAQVALPHAVKADIHGIFVADGAAGPVVM